MNHELVQSFAPRAFILLPVISLTAFAEARAARIKGLRIHERLDTGISVGIALVYLSIAF
jgi:hypothetical protein